MSTRIEVRGHKPEHAELRETVRRFASEEVAPVIAGYYEREEFPYAIVSAMAELGLFGLPFPDELGGMGGGLTELCIAIEELARVDSSVAITLEAAVSLGATPIFKYGTDEQRKTWLPELLAGTKLGAFGLTEPGAGTDAGATATTARLDASTNEWVLNGTKSFITNSGTDITAFVNATAITGTNPDGSKEISTILVPSGTAGMTIAPGYSKVGWLASDTHEIAFVDCRVPAANLIGTRGRGFAQFLETLDGGRVAIAALSVGLAQGCIDESVTYAKERVAFGKPIGSNQAVSFAIADMQARVHTARLATYDAAARLDAGEPAKQEAAIAKLVASDAAVENARAATQVFGGMGFMNETPVARFWRDAKVLEIGEGTNEVQRMLIARSLGL